MGMYAITNLTKNQFVGYFAGPGHFSALAKVPGQLSDHGVDPEDAIQVQWCDWAPDSLDELLVWMESNDFLIWPLCLPTYGGVELTGIEHPDPIWSWDENRVLLGRYDDLKIMYRWEMKRDASDR